ncbi:YqaE/Pmp3 family membrane protein [Cupriavidus necator]|uniref:YqaE/Pmp3 family membrane protein n=1 Tax=Cupriavidus necator TaxID=106590 RepID=UPI003ECDE220
MYRAVKAVFFPWMSFFVIRRPAAGVLCLLLQMTLVGWLPASIWAAHSLYRYEIDQRIARAIADALQRRVARSNCQY